MGMAFDMDRPRERDTSPKIAFDPISKAGDPVVPAQIVVRGSEAATATYLPDF
jgi:hypothetical protein